MERKKTFQNGRSDPSSLRVISASIYHLILLKYEESFHVFPTHWSDSYHSTRYNDIPVLTADRLWHKWTHTRGTVRQSPLPCWSETCVEFRTTYQESNLNPLPETEGMMWTPMCFESPLKSATRLLVSLGHRISFSGANESIYVFCPIPRIPPQSGDLLISSVSVKMKLGWYSIQKTERFGGFRSHENANLTSLLLVCLFTKVFLEPWMREQVLIQMERLRLQ